MLGGVYSLGAVCGKEIYAKSVPSAYHPTNFVTIEMLNILAATNVWAIKWPVLTVRIACDNEAVVIVLDTDRNTVPPLS